MEFDPKALGLMVGLEIHQQLGRPGDTKLFCRCSAEIVEDKPDLVLTRRLRASAGETGTVDIAASTEQAKQKEHIYQAHEGTSCLVELDEEPPRPVNEDVMKTAVMVAKAFKSTILPKVQFMRKTIIDGSAVSGFQRTGLFAIGGEVPGMKVGIQTIGVEEDSAKIVSRDHDRDVFNLSRMGIPLLEIATAPDIKTPEQAKEVAAQMGMVLRSTGRVKRGLGTIRQDLNVSIKGGVRNEIKGAQDLRMIPTIIKYEALRQQSLLEIKKMLGNIAVSDLIDVTAYFKNSKIGFIKKAVASGSKVLGVKVEGFKGIFGKELCPNYRVGTEFADIAKTWGFGGVIHSDEEMKKYGVDDKLSEVFSLKKQDAFFILIGDADRIDNLLKLQFIPRLQAFLKGVPQEVRRANPDGTSSYLRPVPGAARMYPETDIPIVTVQTKGVDAPKLLTEQIETIAKKTGLSRNLAADVLSNNIPILEYKKKYPKLEYAFLSSAFIEWPKEIETKLGVKIENAAKYVEPLLADVASGKIAGSSVKAILEEIGKDPVLDVMKLSAKYKQLSEKELSAVIDTIVKKNKGAPVNALMGVVMTEVRGKADGKLVMKLLKEKTK